MNLTDETLRDELVRRGYKVTREAPQLSGHDPTCVKVDVSVLKLDRALRPTAVALVVEGPVGAIDEVLTAIRAMARKLNNTAETKSIGTTPERLAETTQLLARALKTLGIIDIPPPEYKLPFPVAVTGTAHVDARACCGFHATGGHAQDRHGRDSAHVVYRVVPGDPRVDWIAPSARTSAITGGECSTCLHTPPLHEVWCSTLHETVTLAGAQAMLKEVQKEKRWSDAEKHKAMGCPCGEPSFDVTTSKRCAKCLDMDGEAVPRLTEEQDGLVSPKSIGVKPSSVTELLATVILEANMSLVEIVNLTHAMLAAERSPTCAR